MGAAKYAIRNNQSSQVVDLEPFHILLLCEELSLLISNVYELIWFSVGSVTKVYVMLSKRYRIYVHNS